METRSNLAVSVMEIKLINWRRWRDENHHFRTTAQCKQLKQRIKRNLHSSIHRAMFPIVQNDEISSPLWWNTDFSSRRRPLPINQFSETLENIFRHHASWLMGFRCADDLWLSMFNVLIFWLTDSFAFHSDDDTHELEANFIGFSKRHFRPTTACGIKEETGESWIMVSAV